MDEERERRLRSRQLFSLEQRLLQQLDLSKHRFHRVRSDQWERVYRTIADQFADRTKTRRNGLHWANTNGYSPRSMKKLLGCFPCDRQTWFYNLPTIIQESDKMVYFLLDCGGDWYTGEHILLFESYLPELVQVLTYLNQPPFSTIPLDDYYIISKKYQWLIGFNHHDIVSLVGDGLQPACLKNET